VREEARGAGKLGGVGILGINDYYSTLEPLKINKVIFRLGIKRHQQVFPTIVKELNNNIFVI